MTDENEQNGDPELKTIGFCRVDWGTNVNDILRQKMKEFKTKMKWGNK